MHRSEGQDIRYIITIDNSLAISITPDYTKGVYETYQDATVSIIKSTKRLEVLLNVENHEKIQGIPSWVPNVSIPFNFLSV